MLQYQCSWSQARTHWDCVACEALEDHASQHGRKADCFIIGDPTPQKAKIVKMIMMPSTSDMPPQDTQMASRIPKDDQAPTGDPKDMDLADNDSSEAEGWQPSRGQLSPKKRQGARRKGTPGARSRKGRDLDTFFPLMRRWIVRQAGTASFLPDRIRLDNLDRTLAHYRKQALSFLLPLAEQLLPDKPTTTKERNKWHRRLVFKGRARQILTERLKPNRVFPT